MNDRNIRDGMTVYSSDGEKLGKVISCDADGFLVEKGFFFPKEYFVRYEHAARAEGDDVWLSMSRDELGNVAEADRRYRRDERTTAPAIGREHETSAGALGNDRDDLRVTRSEEELDVLKREKQAGEVRLRKDVVTETKHVDVPVTREEVRVERVPVDRDRAASMPGEASFKEETISMPIREEEVEIRKRPVVKEEIRLKRDRVQQERRADAEVRRETIDIDDSDAKRLDTDRDRDLGSTGLGAPGKDDDLLR